MPPRHLNVILITAAISVLCYCTHRRTRSAIVVGDALNMIDAYYVEPVNRNDLLKAAMSGLTSGLDQHSDFISNDDYVNFQDTIHQEFAGIGIYVEESQPGGPVRVITPLVGSPALQAGMFPGDEIMVVDGVDVSTMSLRDVSIRLKGPIGTTVAITVRRGDETMDLSIRRDRIELESVVGDYRNTDNEWVFRLRQDDSIAYLRLSSFGEKTSDEVRSVLTQLNNDFDAMVIDLRGNGGGLLDSAIEIADMFLDSGNIVSTRIRGGIIEDSMDAEPGVLVQQDKPIAILIDGSSASASEIVAAALQDHGRALIVGTRSYGKGTVQNVLPLQYGRSALRLTVARYYRPSGVNIHRGKDDTEDDIWGVRPSEGGLVELDPESLKEVARRWRESAYPSLVGMDWNAGSNDIDSNDADSNDAVVTDDADLDADNNSADESESEKELADAPESSSATDSQLAAALKLLRQQL